MKNRNFSIFLIFISVVMLATVATAGKETQLTQGERLTQCTSFFGNYIFWTETTGNGLHAFDLNIGIRKDIDGNGMFGSLVINAYGNKVVWTGDDGDSVYMYDISTSNEAKIASGRSLPDIYGNYIVYTNSYQGEDHQNDGIYLYDLSAHKETKISNVYSSPVIYDKKVVWSQANNNNGFDIREYDISTNHTNIITTTNGSIPESELDIYGNIVTWIESGNVYIYDVASHKKTQVTNSGNVSQPAIYGNRLVYTICDQGDIYSPGHTDIYMYDISSASTTRITNSTCAFSPSIYNDKIIYADSRVYPETGEIRNIYLYDLHPENEKLRAAFVTNITSGDAPLTVSFSDISSGVPNAWYWDFGDGYTSTVQNPEHTYSAAGNYTARLRVSDANSTDSISTTITVLKPVPLVANFSANVSEGYVPLSVQFTDLSENAKTLYWEFGDDTFDYNAIFQQNPIHTYTAAGNYTVNLTISDYKITNKKSTTITVLEQPVQLLPIADFNSDLASSSSPLDVQFIDASQNATGWNWDFGDGYISTEQNPKHTYNASGNYTVNLSVSNAYGTASKPAAITVQSQSDSRDLDFRGSSSEGNYNEGSINSGSDGSSSGGNGHSSGSGGGGGSTDGSAEPQSNVELKELSRAFVSNGNSVKFDFPQKATSVVYVSFDSKKTIGKTTTIIEMLKGKSTLVSGVPSDEIYKYLNIWVGNSGFATPKNIDNATVNFKVEKSWIQDKKIDQSSITLNRYSDGKWNLLPTRLSGEDDSYMYFTAQTPEFSPSAITGKLTANGIGMLPASENRTQTATVNEMQNRPENENTAPNIEQTPEKMHGSNTSGNAIIKTPGFEIASGIICLFCVLIYKRR